ncbi:DUF3899 domain-containing protein [Paenisporosarcina sp. TG20]|uniref:DUF3899 domain-containing protein n=1 Tax=Paenisporosarcina sp. TG20 TaxID=1211706 RepID=UPI00036F242F|nr:DUF3899 domain-containing protein [Paenisporosarcina sp. TG20]
MKFRIVLFFTSIITSFFITYLIHQTLSLYKWIDSLFLVGLLLIVTSAILLLIEGQFFTAFIKSCKHFFSRVNRKEQVIRESEMRSNHTASYQNKFPSRRFFFEIGILFCVVSFVVSTTVYYFGR